MKSVNTSTFTENFSKYAHLLIWSVNVFSEHSVFTIQCQSKIELPK